MRNYFLVVALLSITLFSCKKDDGLVLGGTPTPMGEIGNTFASSHNIPGLSTVSAEVTGFEDGVSIITGTGTLTNPDLVDLVNALAPIFPSKITVNGDEVSVDVSVRFTDKGIASVQPEGDLVIVKYDAKVGDVYTGKVDGKTITNKVVARSTDDDYFWDGFMIKVIEVESTGHVNGNLNKVTYYANHKFGLVGVKLLFDNDNTISASIYSDNIN
ncbi:MAG: hypothetical protein R2753_14295 [Chitinophagales bacterium]